MTSNAPIRHVRLLPPSSLHVGRGEEVGRLAGSAEEAELSGLVARDAVEAIVVGAGDRL